MRVLSPEDLQEGRLASRQPLSELHAAVCSAVDHVNECLNRRRLKNDQVPDKVRVRFKYVTHKRVLREAAREIKRSWPMTRLNLKKRIIVVERFPTPLPVQQEPSELKLTGTE